MRRVVLSKNASNRLGKFLEYLEKEWSLKDKNNFLKKLDKSLTKIQKYPESCIETNSVKGLRMLIVTKQTSLFYKFNSKTIFVITIFDNRMSPTKLEKETQ